MSLFSIIYQKLYYIFLDIILPKTKFNVPTSISNKINIFIYFDYEREFGGHSTSVSDDDINYILEFLKTNSVKTTWFTVGKIFNKYSNSIKNINYNNHEIGSHTYGHVVPLELKTKTLKKDFNLYSEIINDKNKTIGFHSPKGRWSFGLIKLLIKYNYTYDVVGASKGEQYIPFYIIKNNKKLLRFHTLGDDWPLYNKNYSEEDVFEYFKNKIKKIKPGNIGGMGFHPWVLFSNTKILHGFEKFISYVIQQKSINIELASFYANTLLQEEKSSIK